MSLPSLPTCDGDRPFLWEAVLVSSSKPTNRNSVVIRWVTSSESEDPATHTDAEYFMVTSSAGDVVEVVSKTSMFLSRGPAVGEEDLASCEFHFSRSWPRTLYSKGGGAGASGSRSNTSKRSAATSSATFHDDIALGTVTCSLRRAFQLEARKETFGAGPLRLLHLCFQQGILELSSGGGSASSNVGDTRISSITSLPLLDLVDTAGLSREIKLLPGSDALVSVVAATLVEQARDAPADVKAQLAEDPTTREEPSALVPESAAKFLLRFAAGTSTTSSSSFNKKICLKKWAEPFLSDSVESQQENLSLSRRCSHESVGMGSPGSLLATVEGQHGGNLLSQGTSTTTTGKEQNLLRERIVQLEDKRRGLRSNSKEGKADVFASSSLPSRDRKLDIKNAELDRWEKKTAERRERMNMNFRTPGRESDNKAAFVEIHDTLVMPRVLQKDKETYRLLEPKEYLANERNLVQWLELTFLLFASGCILLRCGSVGGGAKSSLKDAVGSSASVEATSSSTRRLGSHSTSHSSSSSSSDQYYTPGEDYNNPFFSWFRSLHDNWRQPPAPGTSLSILEEMFGRGKGEKKRETLACAAFGGVLVLASFIGLWMGLFLFYKRSECFANGKYLKRYFHTRTGPLLYAGCVVLLLATNLLTTS
ncbi:unnamed protein product [Amoebophrya sp. A25]|nr:unnamed protein product [Amoebophrya sp. A25]|eukprot:GSA25T00005461001.1